MRRFLTPRVPARGERVELADAPSHHLLRVTGIAPGERVGLFDGQGGACIAQLVSVEGGRAMLEWVAEAEAGCTPRLATLLLPLLRHGPMETAVRMATEMGVSAIQPFHAARSIAGGDRCERWRRVAESAAAQCGRCDVPDVRAVRPLAEAIDSVPIAWRRLVCLPGAPIRPTPDGPLAVLVGPEGGLAPDEVDHARAAGFLPWGLGPHVLRADTAVAAALARLL